MIILTVCYGPAYKGIPLATAAAGALYNEYKIDKPYFFNRKEEKTTVKAVHL